MSLRLRHMLERPADALAGGGTAGSPPWRRRWLQPVRRLSRRGVSWALADQALVSAFNFLTIYLYARSLSAASFGVLLLAYSGLRLLTALQGAVVVGPHNVLGAALEGLEYRRFTTALVVLQVVVATGVTAILAIAGVIVTYAVSPQYGEIVLVIAIIVWPFVSRDFVRRAFFTRGNSRAATFNDVISYGLQLVGALAITYWDWGRSGPEAAFFVFGVSSLASIIAAVPHLRHEVAFDSETLHGMTESWAKAWHFGKWVVAKNVLEWFGSRGHSWVVAIMLGTGAVGTYRAATHLANVMNPLRLAATNYLPARGSYAFQMRGHAGLTRWVARVAVALAVALVPFGILLIGFPHDILHLAYGTRYSSHELAEILALSTVGQIIGFVRYPCDVGILAMRSTRSLFYVAIIPVILLATCGVALIHVFGILGVPLSLIVMNASLLATTWWIYLKLMREQTGLAVVKKPEAQ